MATARQGAAEVRGHWARHEQAWRASLALTRVTLSHSSHTAGHTHGFAQPEVAELHVAVRIQQQIVGLDVPVMCHMPPVPHITAVTLWCHSSAVAARRGQQRRRGLRVGPTAPTHTHTHTPVDVVVLVDGLDGHHGLCAVEARLLFAQDVLAHEQRLCSCACSCACSCVHVLMCVCVWCARSCWAFRHTL
jgi:hypothetical protein